jgi:hypothetical protein
LAAAGSSGSLDTKGCSCSCSSSSSSSSSSIAAAAAGAASCCQLPHLDSVYVVDLCPHVQHAHFIVAVLPIGTSSSPGVCQGHTAARKQPTKAHHRTTSSRTALGTALVTGQRTGDHHPLQGAAAASSDSTAQPRAPNEQRPQTTLNWWHSAMLDGGMMNSTYCRAQPNAAQSYTYTTAIHLAGA